MSLHISEWPYDPRLCYFPIADLFFGTPCTILRPEETMGGLKIILSTLETKQAEKLKSREVKDEG